MTRKLIYLIFMFTLITVGIGVYLSPDSLKGCDKTPSSKENCSAVDAIVVISGGDTKARTDEAIDLYKNGWSNKLVLSGAAQDKSGPSNAAAMRTNAISAGVPDEDIYIDEYAESTQQNAQNSQLIFKEYGIKKIILVTSGYHQRRASLEFNKYSKIDDITILNHPADNDKDWSSTWWTTPHGWWLTTNELAKILAFYLSSIKL